MPDRITTEAVQALLDASTPGRMRIAVMDPTKDPVEVFRECMSYGAGDIWGVLAVDHPETVGGLDDRPEHGAVTCWTGNGPASVANAQLYIAARDIAEDLIDAREALAAIHSTMGACDA